MKKILLVLLLGMFLISLVSATNVSILYGKNTSSGEMVPVEVNDDGSLKTTLDLTESTGLIPKLDNAYNIGTAVLRWAKGYFFNFNIDNNLTVVGNVTADYFFGNGSQLTGIGGGDETDPFWTGNQSLYYLKNNPFSFYNSSDFSISNYYLKSNPFGFYNSTNPQTETDPLWTGNETNVARTENCPAGQVVMNTTTSGVQCITPPAGDEVDPYWTGNQSLYYLKSNPFGFYNITDFNIDNYYLKSNPFGFWNSTTDGAGSGLDADTLDTHDTSYFYAASNPSGYTSNTGTVTSVATGTGISGGTITTSGTLTVAGGTCLTADANGLGVTAAGCKTNWDAAYTHKSSTGADHSYINQAVTTTSNPQFAGVKLGGTTYYLGSGAAASKLYTLYINEIYADLGSNTDPSYTFNGDVNTGMYSGAADNIRFTTGGAESMRITTSAITFYEHAYARDHGTASTDMLVNVVYGTGSPPAAVGTTIGTLWVKYTA